MGALQQQIEAALTVAPFERRLCGVLSTLAQVSGARGYALVDMGSEQRVLRHVVRCQAGALGDDLRAEALEGLLARAAAAGGQAELGAEVVDQKGVLHVKVLAVEPPLWHGPDAGVLLLDPAAPVPDGVWRTVADAMSEQRRTDLGMAVATAVEMAVDPIELADAAVRVLHVNEAWQRHTGYGRDEVVGRFLSLLRDPDAPVHDPTFYKHTEQAIDGNGNWVGFIASRGKDGRRLSQEVSVSSFGRPNDRFRGNFGVRRSVESRAARDEALALSRVELRNLLLALPVPVVVLRAGKVAFCNAHLVELLGETAERLFGAELRAFFHPEDRELALHDAQAIEVRVLRPDGGVRLVDATAAGSVSFEGGPAAIIFLRDRTERRLMREQRASGDRLSAVVTIASSIGHEVNNPLATIVSTLGALLEDEPDGRLATALQDALGAARRIQGVAGELRGLAQIRSSDAAEGVPLSLVVTAGLQLSGNQLRHLSRVERSGDDDLLVMIPEQDLLQVVVQLLANAAEALPSGEPDRNMIRITAGLDGDTVVVGVEDNGSGVDPAVLPRAFEPFVTGRAGRKGLGLAIVRAIVQGHGGSIALHSAQLGTRAELRLPGRRAGLASDRPIPQEPTRGRIIVVDDEAALARAIARTLRDHDVELFDDGADALVRLAADPEPDLILCDLMMPGMTGPALYAAVGRIRPQLQARFLFLTGGAFTEEGRSFIRQMGPRVMEKPFLPSALRARVAAELRARRAAR